MLFPSKLALTSAFSPFSEVVPAFTITTSCTICTVRSVTNKHLRDDCTRCEIDTRGLQYVLEVEAHSSPQIDLLMTLSI